MGYDHASRVADESHRISSIADTLVRQHLRAIRVDKIPGTGITDGQADNLRDNIRATLELEGTNLLAARGTIAAQRDVIAELQELLTTTTPAG